MTEYAVFDYLYNEPGIFPIDEIIRVEPSSNSLAPNGTAIITTGGMATVKNGLQEVLSKLESLGWNENKYNKKVVLTALNGAEIEVPVYNASMIIGCRPKHNYTNIFYVNGLSYNVKETPVEVLNLFKE